MKINRQGVTRIVLVFKKVVIKIPNFSYQWDHFLLGLIANIRESRGWKSSKITGSSSLLCPVLWTSWGGWILIMKRVQICSWEQEIDYQPWIDASFQGDDKPTNYGYLEGRIVKVDYGD